MKSKWHQHLKNEEDREKFKLRVNDSKPVLTRLESILNEYQQSEVDKMVGENDFNKPDWANLQAYRSGKIAGMKIVKELLDGLTEK